MRSELKHVFVSALLGLTVLAPGRMWAQRAMPTPGRGGPVVEAAEKVVSWNSLEMVFTGRLESVQRGPVAKSFPPIYSATLTFTVEQAIRGDLKKGRKLVLGHSARQHDMPTYPEGELCLVGAETGAHNKVRIVRIEKAEADMLKDVIAACQLPLGWRVQDDGRPVSPWAEMAGVWPEELGNLGSKTVCSKSGRPALMCGPGVAMTVKPVPPKEKIKWTNPDGDGEYEITVENVTDKPVSVPALLTNGREICWANSVVILCQDKAYPAPGCRTGMTKLEPVILKPGESVSGVVNALALDGPEWPRGGYRIRFQFCLGEQSVSHSFYYLSRHHDRIRDAQ